MGGNKPWLICLYVLAVSIVSALSVFAMTEAHKVLETWLSTASSQVRCHAIIMDLNLKGRVAVITGGAAGIGEAIGDALAAEGCKICIVDRNAETGGQLVRRRSGNQAHLLLPMSVILLR